MFNLGDAGVNITLVDSGGIGTFGDGGGTVRTAGFRVRMLVSAGSAIALSNISARSIMACCWALTNWKNGVTCAGLVRASVRARAATITALSEDVFGTGHWCEKNCTVLAVQSDLVFGTHSR